MGIGSIHPNGNPYQLKGAGSFFLQNNKIFNSPYEVAELLRQDWGIEILSSREQFIKQKEQKNTQQEQAIESLFIPKMGPPESYGGKFRNNFSKIGNY